MKIMVSSRRIHYMARISILLIMVVLIAEMVGCSGGDESYTPIVAASNAHVVRLQSDSTVVALGCNCSQTQGSTQSTVYNCFIATAAYGTPMAEEVQFLREFRDKYLLMNPLGQAVVNFYYRVSPPIAEFITEHPGLKPIVRAGLVPVIAMSIMAVTTAPAEKIAIIGLLVLVSAALAVWVKRKRCSTCNSDSINPQRHPKFK